MGNMAFDYAEVIYLPNAKNKEESPITAKYEKPIEKRYIKDTRIFTNTIEQAVDIMNRSGVETRYDIVRKEDRLEISIIVRT